MNQCPCGTKQKYDTCCGRFISRLQKPQTPEQLMRSRYTAFTRKDIQYLTKTMLEPAFSRFDFANIEEWLATVRWKRLEIIATSLQEKKGYVEFIAHFTEYGQKGFIHELSEFHQINDVWFYIDGKFTNKKHNLQKD